ncbi:MAG: phBC6A51 family helix-turn-helix protein [Patescibacteria group bacterium]|nr:phBC6A51 family helix-turn-helix protein [Patescibacteria group bacterium]
MAKLKLKNKKKNKIIKDIKKTKKRKKKDDSNNPNNIAIFKLTKVDFNRVKDPLKLREFILFFATPKLLRDEETQKEFSKRIGVGEDTLSNWKQLDGFWDEVALLRKKMFKAKSTEVLSGLFLKARLGNAKEVELYWKIVEGWSDKVRIEDETPETLLEKTERESIKKALNNWENNVRK